MTKFNTLLVSLTALSVPTLFFALFADLSFSVRLPILLSLIIVSFFVLIGHQAQTDKGKNLAKKHEKSVILMVLNILTSSFLLYMVFGNPPYSVVFMATSTSLLAYGVYFMYSHFTYSMDIAEGSEGIDA